MVVRAVIRMDGETKKEFAKASVDFGSYARFVKWALAMHSRFVDDPEGRYMLDVLHTETKLPREDVLRAALSFAFNKREEFVEFAKKEHERLVATGRRLPSPSV